MKSKEELLERFSNLKEAYEQAVKPEAIQRQNQLRTLVENHRENLENLSFLFQNKKISANTFNKRLEELTSTYNMNYITISEGILEEASND